MSLVRDLTGTELAAIASEVAAGRVENTLKALDERGRAQELVRQQYSGRYPFELMQNAADAAAEAGRGGRVRFHLSDDALLVADNGSGFGAEQVKSICSLGRSSKNPAKSIGYKGLGFKSVGEITDRPQVISDGIRFEFDDSRVLREVSALTGPLPEGQRLPTYAYPFDVARDSLGADAVIVDELLASGYRTVMRLPLRTGVGRAEIARHLHENLAPQLMLFLNSLEELRLTGTGADFVGFVTRETQDGADRVLLEADGATTEWLVYSRPLPVTQELVAPLGDGWNRVEAVTTAIAIPVGDDGSPTTGATYPLHVYFPTDEASGFPFIAHADWALHLDRRQLATTPESAAYNRELTRAVVDLICAVVAPDLASRFGDPVAPAAVLTPRGAAIGAGADLHAQLSDALRDVAFVATVGGEMRKPGEVRLLHPKCPDVQALHELSDLSGHMDLVADGIERDSQIREAVVGLGRATFFTREMTLVETLQLLRPPDAASAERYYQHLVDWDQQVGRNPFSQALKSVPCVLLQDGQAVAPASRVYLPRTNDSVSIALPLPIAVLPGAVDGLEALLKQAGVREFDWRNIIPDFLVPLLSDPGRDEVLRQAALDSLRAYVRVQRTGDRTVHVAVAEVLVPVRTVRGPDRGLAPARAVYFGSDWTGDHHLEDIYGPFGEVEFLDAPVPDDTSERAREKEFWEFLGVADCPRVLSVEPSGSERFSTSSLIWQHPHHTDLYWSWWLDDPEVAAAMGCPQGHPASQVLASSYVLDRFDQLVRAGDHFRLRRLWEELAARWGRTYEPATTARFRCVHGNHAGDPDRPVPSLLKATLLFCAWVPARRGRDPILVAPWQAWRVANQTPRHIRARVVTLPEPMAAGPGARLVAELGVTDAARLSPDDLFGLLRELAQESRDVEPDADLIKAAQWTMRTLDEAVKTGTQAAPAEPVPLLATVDGRYTFSTEPLVVRDPLLREAWGTHRPVLAADSDITMLPRVLGLVALDDEVTVTPMEYGHRDDLVDALQRQVEDAAPWMLALLRKLRPSAEEDFVRRIKRLDVRPCNELVLEYSYDGDTHELSDAVSHIATRREAGSRGGAFAGLAGTAYLEVDRRTGAPHWYEFGPQLAAFVRAENYGDQFGHILVSDEVSREQILAAKRITRDDLREAAEILGHAELDVEDLVDFAADDYPMSLSDEPSLGGGVNELPEGGSAEAEDDSTSGRTAGSSDPSAPSDTASGASSASGAEGGKGASGAGTGDDAPVTELPPLDGDEIFLEEGEPGPTHHESRERGDGGGAFGGGGWTSDPPMSERERRALGRRGEEAALLAERRRVARLGFDPGVVVWRSDMEQYAPHDLESVDEHGVSVFIEVKSTTGADPSAPFEISQGELTEAIRHGDKYVVYRVTSVRSATPQVRRYANPIGLFLDGLASLDLAKARMRFGRDAT